MNSISHSRVARKPRARGARWLALLAGSAMVSLLWAAPASAQYSTRDSAVTVNESVLDGLGPSRAQPVPAAPAYGGHPGAAQGYVPGGYAPGGYAPGGAQGGLAFPPMQMPHSSLLTPPATTRATPQMPVARTAAPTPPAAPPAPAKPAIQAKPTGQANPQPATTPVDKRAALDKQPPPTPAATPTPAPAEKPAAKATPKPAMAPPPPPPPAPPPAAPAKAPPPPAEAETKLAQQEEPRAGTPKDAAPQTPAPQTPAVEVPTVKTPEIKTPEPPAPATNAPAPDPAPTPVADENAVRLLFPAASSELDAAAEDKLAGIAADMQRDENLRIQLLAYAAGSDSEASRARRLSLARALSVRSYLLEKGIRSTRIDVRALGNKVPDEPADRVDVVPAAQ